MVADEQAGTEHPVERWVTSLAALALGLVCIFVVLTVTARWLGRVLIPDDVLIVRQMLVAVILLPLASVSVLRMHIAVTLLADRLSKPWVDVLLRLGNAIGLLVVALLLWGGIRLLQSSWASQEYYEGEFQIPHWIGHATYVVALATAAVRLARETLRRRADAAPSLR